MPAPHVRSTAADLVRLLAAWLAAILLVQGLAAGLALGAGPLHRHHEHTATPHAHDVHHPHDGAERHHHRAGDASIAPDAAEPALDSAALVAALALLAFALACWRVAPDTRRHTRPAALPLDWRSTATPPLLRPPKRG
jgi:hypothetical protein